MVDVNEEIVRKYFELQGYFVQTDVLYLKPKEKTGKKSSGYGDIDLIITNPRTGDRAIVGVSGWHTERITPSYAKDLGERLFGFAGGLAQEKAAGILGSKKFRRILVVSRLSVKKGSRARFLEEARKFVDQIVEFPTILQELINAINTRISYDSEVLQTLRLLKIFGFLRTNGGTEEQNQGNSSSFPRRFSRPRKSSSNTRRLLMMRSVTDDAHVLTKGNMHLVYLPCGSHGLYRMSHSFSATHRLR